MLDALQRCKQNIYFYVCIYVHCIYIYMNDPFPCGTNLLEVPAIDDTMLNDWVHL
jgi:hypothetical protein